MAKVVLHIGAHKTATSFLQAAFHRNRTKLASVGLHYPDIGPNNAHHTLAGQWIKIPDLPPDFYDARGPSGLWQNLIESYAQKPGTVFLSAENFSRWHPEKVNKAELADILSAFEDIRIVYTLRRQVDLVPSVWAQISKQVSVPSIWSFMRTVFDQRRARGVPIDHNAVYHDLLTGFDPAQIHLLDYSDFAMHPRGVVGVFLDLMGIEISANTLATPDQNEANISPDPMAIFLASRIIGDDSTKPPPAHLISYLQDHLDDIIGPRRSVLARHEYTKLKERFRHGNQTLVQEVHPYQPGFAFDEGTTPDDLVYRDDLTEKEWTKIAAKLYEMVQHTHANPKQPKP